MDISWNPLNTPKARILNTREKNKRNIGGLSSMTRGRTLRSGSSSRLHRWSRVLTLLKGNFRKLRFYSYNAFHSRPGISTPLALAFFKNQREWELPLDVVL